MADVMGAEHGVLLALVLHVVRGAPDHLFDRRPGVHRRCGRSSRDAHNCGPAVATARRDELP
eukprot:962401-Alexandrium_andersonii.AAC.1